MSQAQFTVPLITVIPGQLITAALWNNEWTNIGTNLNPSGVGGYEDTDTQMQIQTAPYPGSVTSHATSTAGEFERIRYQIAAITGKTYWYQAPDASIATLFNTVLPLGSVIDYHSATPPNANFLLADGQAIGRTAYASLNTLYSAASYPFGNGDGVNTFNLPNYQDRISIGVNSIVASAGATAGAQTHTLAAGEIPSGVPVTITDPGHTHTITDPQHSHGITDPGHSHVERAGSGGAVASAVQSNNFTSLNGVSTGSSTASATTGVSSNNASTGITNNSNTTGISAQTNGTGSAHSILNPVIGMYKMIRVL